MYPKNKGWSRLTAPAFTKLFIHKTNILHSGVIKTRTVINMKLTALHVVLHMNITKKDYITALTLLTVITVITIFILLHKRLNLFNPFNSKYDLN